MSDTQIDEGALAEPAAEVNVKGTGIQISRPVSEKQLSDIITILFGGKPSGGVREDRSPRREQAESGARGGSGQWDGDMTLGEFIDDTQPRNFQQKICAAGYYLTDVRGADTFSMEDVKAALADAREDMPANFNRDFREAVQKSFVAPKIGAEPSQHYVPRTGRTAVESRFTELPKSRTRRSSKKKAGVSNGDAE